MSSKEPAKNSATKPQANLTPARRATVPDYQPDADTLVERTRMAPNPLTPHDVLRLQRTIGNQAVGQLLTQKAKQQPLVMPLETRVSIQRRIVAKNKTYVEQGQKVTNNKNKKWGVGTIVGFKGQQYQVNFGGRIGERYVNANDLDLAEDKTDESEVKTEVPEIKIEESEVKTEESEVKDEKSEVKAEKTETKRGESEGLGSVPTQLRLLQSGGTSKKPKWKIILLNESGETLAEVDQVAENEVKNYVERKNRITEAQVTKVREGTYPLKENATLLGMLEDSYLKLSQERRDNEELKRLREERTKTTDDKSTTLSQKEIFDRLKQLQYAKKQKGGAGHPSITMTKILLDKTVKLSVGGVEREITHLYTQPGNETEIRCYLGNEKGAYQRVHTSLTVQEGETPTAHTMIQTGDEVVVPSMDEGRKGGTRIGLNSTEGKKIGGKGGYGLENREFSIRSQKQCTVGDWLQGEEWHKLGEEQQQGCYLLADTFNAVLDKVCEDVNKGDPEGREVTGITEDFAILDDDWLFEGKTPATPEAEWKHHEKTKSEAKREEKEDVVGSSSSEMKGMEKDEIGDSSLRTPRKSIVALDKRDVVEYKGHRFAPNVKDVRDLGQCFWDTLRKKRVDEKFLSAAAEKCGIKVDQHVDAREIASFLEALSVVSEHNYSIILVTFDILSPTLDFLAATPLGTQGEGTEMYIGLFMDETQGEGHYVPELD